MANKQTKKEKKNLLQEAINDFVLDLEGLYQVLPVLMAILYIYQKSKGKKYDKFFKDFGKHNRKNQYYIRQPYISKARDLEREIKIVHTATHITPESFLVTIISLYDGYLGKLLKNLFTLKPQYLNSSGKTVFYGEIVETESLEGLKSKILEKEIESVLRSSHVDQFSWMEKTFDIKLRVDLPSWPRFVEITERRNLFVHADGYISAQYLNVCNENGVKTENLKIGERLGVDPKYFKDAYRVIFEIATKLTHVLWRKILPDDISKADENLSDEICFRLLKNKEYDLAINLLDFATNILKKHSSDEHRRINIVNKAIAYKWKGNNKEAQDILNKDDWSATNDQFQLAIAVLRDDFKLAATILESMGAKSKLGKEAYMDWPLYKEFRKSNIFLKTYKKIYKKPFDQLEKSEDSLQEDKIHKDIKDVIL